jgi:hypothetical protein
VKSSENVGILYYSYLRWANGTENQKSNMNTKEMQKRCPLIFYIVKRRKRSQKSDGTGQQRL